MPRKLALGRNPVLAQAMGNRATCDVFVLGEGESLDVGICDRCRRDDTGALTAIALAGLKTRHYNLRAWNAQR